MENSNNHTYHLEPGYIYSSNHGDVIRTVIGSCVAVCLWDNEKRVGGVCCYLYAGGKKPKERNGKFSDAAVTQLIKMMKDMGCKKENLGAQIYGGGCRDGYSVKEAEKRVKAGKKILEKLKIKIISEDIGGTMGRKILFDTASGHAAVLKVHDTRQEDWF